MPVSFLDGQNHTMPVPVDISTRPDLHGTVPIETAPSHTVNNRSGSVSKQGGGAAASGSSSGPSANASGSSAQPAGQPNDVAGVLRRNQACLACRRRKLKCDAVRPHCSTCVRSYRHLLRTAPGTQPVLSCEYDDATERENGGDPEHTSPVDEDEEGKKKRRKTSGSRAKKRDEENDVERDKLTKRIAELEAQLARKTAAAAAAPMQAAHALQSEARWTNAAASGGFLEPQVQSPTAFLEMLSSAASSAPNAQPTQGGVFPGIIPMWTSADRSEATGLTPFFPMADPDIAGTPGNRPPGSPAPNMLSPNGVFNFSPGPSATLQWPPPTAASWPPPTTDPSVQSMIQSAVRDMGALAGVAEMAGSAFTGPMIGPGASTPAPPPQPPLPSSRSNSKSGPSGSPPSEIFDTCPLNDLKSGQPKAKTFEETLNASSAEAYNAAVAEGSIDPQVLVDLFWPGWPPNLPEPPAVTQLVETFFDTVPSLPRMLHRARFLARLALPPTHSNFPHPALLHAICALAATWIPQLGPNYTESPPAPGNYNSKADFIADTGRKGKPSSMPFSLRQAAFGKDAVLDGLNTGNRLFDVVRAMIILSRVFIDDTRMLECWTYTGLVARMILPLGLNVRSAELSLKSAMLPPAADALEREERRIVVWMAMFHDTISSAASGWGSSIALDELTVALPVSAADFDLGREDMEPNPQDLESLDLYIKHPVPDPFVMTLKGAVLLNRVNKFARRWKNRRLRENDDLDGMQRPEFRELANAIACLQMSFPQALQDPCRFDEKGKLDVDTITAHVIPQAAIICLYEPFADVSDPNDQPARRILNAARSIINVVQQIVSVTPNGFANLAAVMHSATSVALVTAARTCLLFYRQALNVQDTAQAESYRSDIETARLALAQYGTRFKIGYHHAQLIEYFLDRATTPTYEKLAAHYPEHPRPGAMILTPTSNFGLCIMNALNIKRGFWKIPTANGGTNVGVSIHSVSPNHVSPNGTSNSPVHQNGNTPSESPPLSSNNPASVGSTPGWTHGGTSRSATTGSVHSLNSNSQANHNSSTDSYGTQDFSNGAFIFMDGSNDGGPAMNGMGAVAAPLPPDYEEKTSNMNDMNRMIAECG